MGQRDLIIELMSLAPGNTTYGKATISPSRGIQHVSAPGNTTYRKTAVLGSGEYNIQGNLRFSAPGNAKYMKSAFLGLGEYNIQEIL